MQELIYLKAAESLYVNLYVPSKVTNLYNDKLVTLTQTTEYPAENQTQFTISCTDKVQFDLKIRIPSWINGTVEVQVNGKAKKVEAKAGEWLSLGTEWKNGDSVVVEFPLEVYAEAVEDKVDSACAFMYGPVMLVAENATTNTIQLEKSKVSNAFVKKTNDVFSVTDDSGRVYAFKPFYKVTKNITYNTFFMLK